MKHVTLIDQNNICTETWNKVSEHVYDKVMYGILYQVSQEIYIGIVRRIFEQVIVDRAARAARDYLDDIN